MNKNKKAVIQLIPDERIESKIYLFRGKKVMLDSDLAELYGVGTKTLNRAVSRNRLRFPIDFMYQLTRQEVRALRCQIGTLDNQGRGRFNKYLPYVFTEQGVAMLSSVLNSERAIQVNIQIMRTFTKLKEMLQSHEELRRKIEALEKKYDHQFRAVFEAIKQLMEEPEPEEKPKRKIGFHA